jgi:hypothetical protein
VEVEEFSALFERFERSAFRVEARDRYNVDHEREAFAAFREGRKLRPRTTASDPWPTLVAAHAAAGRVIERVRIVSERSPSTPASSSRPTATTSLSERRYESSHEPPSPMQIRAGRARISGSSTRSC